MNVRPATADDWPWIRANADAVGGERVVSRGVLHTLADHPALIAQTEDGEPVGFAVYRFDQHQTELIAIASTQQWQGVGSRLLEQIEAISRNAGANQVWLCTTNDNLEAIRFYQRRGYRLTELNVGAFEAVKRIKGLQGEVVGHFEIPIRDELVLQKEI